MENLLQYKRRLRWPSREHKTLTVSTALQSSRQRKLNVWKKKQIFKTEI